MPNRFKQGDPLRISAYAWNRMLDSIGYDVDANSDWRKGSLPVSWLYVKNVHRSPRIERGSPVCVVAPTDLTGVELIEYRTNPQDFVFHSIHSWFGNYHHQHFGIALEPIEYEGVGRVAVGGIVWANFKVVDGVVEDYIDSAKYLHMLPDTDPDYHEFLQLNTSGFAERFGDHIRLNSGQPIFMYEISDLIRTDVSPTYTVKANIYGLPHTLSSTGAGGGKTYSTTGAMLVVEDVVLVVEPPQQCTGYALGDIGLCTPLGDHFRALDEKHSSPILGEVVDDPIISGACGFVELYRASGSSCARYPLLNASDEPLKAKVAFDMPGDLIPVGAMVHAKCVGGVHVIDVVECP